MTKRKQDPRKAAALAKEWEAMLAKHAAPLERGAKAKGVRSAPVVKTKSITAWVGNEREVNRLPSHVTPGGDTSVPRKQAYTGTLIKGIATMHKSNAVPILNEDDAVAVATMRR
ncbi:hypothetical protein FDI24_gp251 [Acidovorax phage ACP17]|uniref:Uncharacterized protein n=1 Tax=Acidovorax phage ACP17 TaxID=2010329 RepID=A0A218M3A5_9CAUD|nr:hypothetical protein FDI24_gp251 [Acidovorax phage ACP17]ASD50532.1 hypothetical protein [Acidovorax phage ACP17]